MQSSQRRTIEATGQQLLGLHVERAGLVGLRVEREEAADDLVRFGQDPFVHALAEVGELPDAIGFRVAGAAHAAASKGSNLPARCSAIMSS
jgi:hypothetical protein